MVFSTGITYWDAWEVTFINDYYMYKLCCSMKSVIKCPSDWQLLYEHEKKKN